MSIAHALNRKRLASFVLLLSIASLVLLALPTRVGAAPTGSSFDHVVIIAMENQNYVDVLGDGTSAGCPSGTASFLCGMLPFSSTIPNYHSYGAGGFSGDSIGGCSAACYTALISGDTQGVSDGYGCCLSGTTLVDQMQSAGLTWQAYCESGCPRGNDHFPFTGFSSDANSPNVFAGSSVSTSTFIASANSASPPNLLWYTPTDNHNMHDNSIQTGDSYLQQFLVGSSNIQSPASGSLLASSVFTSSSYRTLLYIWWDEYDPSPNIILGSGAQKGFISQSNSYDEYASLHTVENKWELAALGYASSAPTMSDVFGSTTTTLSPSFAVSPSTPVSGQTVTFIAAASGGTSPYSYSWNLAGTTKTGNSVSQSFTSGTYTTSLTVTDSLGKTATTSKYLTVLLASSGGPAPLYTLSFQGYDFDGANEETLTVNGNQVATIPTALTSSNGATWVSFSFNITSFTVQGTNTVSFTHANSDCAVSDQVRNLVVANQTSTLFSNATVENINTATSCTNTLTYTFTIGLPSLPPAPNFTISTTSPGAVNTGQSTLTTITITSLNGFTGTVALTDTVPNGLSCGNISNTSLAGSGTATVSCSATNA